MFNNNKIKIFLAYHNNFPKFESETFLPVFAGRELFDGETDILGDNTGDNISKLNEYYSEISMYYWVWKNYIPMHTELEYVGFAHYRRIPDLTHVYKDPNVPAIGINVDIMEKIFEWMNSKDLYSVVSPYDILFPNKSYFTAHGIGPCSENDPPRFRVIDVWNSDPNFHEASLGLMKEVLAIIKEKTPIVYPYALRALSEKSAYLYNMYIMKRDLLDDFFEWLFTILVELNIHHDMWDGFQYKRLLGYLTERMVNFWLEWKLANEKLKIAHYNHYFVDVYRDNIASAHVFNALKLKELELIELSKVADLNPNVASINNRIKDLKKELKRVH